MDSSDDIHFMEGQILIFIWAGLGLFFMGLAFYCLGRLSFSIGIMHEVENIDHEWKEINK